MLTNPLFAKSLIIPNKNLILIFLLYIYCKINLHCLHRVSSLKSKS
jgi:hypothetical protein